MGQGNIVMGIVLENFSTGKTLILEASIKTLSQKENIQVFFVNALGMTLCLLSLGLSFDFE